MSDTPETDKHIKDNKHIRFLEEDHWSGNGKFTLTHPTVALCRRIERQRNELREQRKKLYGVLEMVRDADEDCHKDGLTTIPPVARHRIDMALAAVKGGEL